APRAPPRHRPLSAWAPPPPALARRHLPVDHLGRYAAPSFRSRIHNFRSYLPGTVGGLSARGSSITQPVAQSRGEDRLESWNADSEGETTDLAILKSRLS